MSGLRANVINELDKIFLRRKNIILLILSALIPMGAALSFNLLQSKLGIFAINSSNFSILLLELFTAFFLPLFIFSVASEVFAGELGDKTLKLTLTRPISRFNVFLSKNMAIVIFIVLNLAVIFTVSTISGMFLKNFLLTFNSFFKGLLAYGIAIIPMVFLSIFAVFIGQFFKSSGGALMTSIFVYLVAKFLPFLSSNIGKISPFSYNDWYLTWLGNSISLVKQLNVFLLILSSMLIFFTVGFYLFDKKDL